MSVALYELAIEYREIAQAIYDADGELTPELNDAFDAINVPFEEKLDAIAALIREFESREMARRREAAHQSKKASVNGNAVRRLKNKLKECMQVAGIKSHRGLFDITICKNPLSVKWTGDPDKIPGDFRNERTEISVNSAAVLAAHKRGETLPEGFEFAQGTHTRVS